MIIFSIIVDILVIWGIVALFRRYRKSREGKPRRPSPRNLLKNVWKDLDDYGTDPGSLNLRRKDKNDWHPRYSPQKHVFNWDW